MEWSLMNLKRETSHPRSSLALKITAQRIGILIGKFS